MFHLHTFDSIKFNIPLESLKIKKNIKKLNKNSSSRKYISNEDSSTNKKYSYAIKAYKEAVEITSEKEVIFHAYEIMSSPVKTVNPEMKIIEAWKYCKKEEVGHLPIVTPDKKLIGIVSDRDLLKHLIIEDEKATNIPGKTISRSGAAKKINLSSLKGLCTCFGQLHPQRQRFLRNDNILFLFPSILIRVSQSLIRLRRIIREK